MNNENTEKLFNRFPFFKPDAPITESLMSFGFECGDGWFSLLWDLCLKLEEEDSVKQILQVKEKFGSLRFYVDGASDAAYQLINQAEEMSETTCEKCGGKSSISNQDGWYSTVCC